MKVEGVINHFLLADGNVVHQMQIGAEFGDPIASMLLVKIPQEMLGPRAVARLRHLADEIEAHAGGTAPRAAKRKGKRA